MEKKCRGFGLSNIFYVKSFMVQSVSSRGVDMGTSEEEAEEDPEAPAAEPAPENVDNAAKKPLDWPAKTVQIARSADTGSSRRGEMSSSRGSQRGTSKE